MEKSFPLSDCNDNDILSFKDSMLKVGKVRGAVQKAFKGTVAKTLSDSLKSQGVEINPGGEIVGNDLFMFHSKWFSEGIDCEVLQLGNKDWQKGKVKIKVSLEFCPDEQDVTDALESNELEINQLESPLDELRRTISKDV